MEIGEQPSDNPKLKPRHDKELRITRSRGNVRIPRGGMFERANRGCADGHNAPASVERPVDAGGCLWLDLALFRMKLMRLHLGFMNRLKRSESDVQRDFDDLDAALRKLPHDPPSQVKTRRRSSHRARLPGVYGLVTPPVERLIRPANIGRERHVPDPAEFPFKRSGVSKAECSQTVIASPDDFGLQALGLSLPCLKE
jgi:hypothetical protein